MKAFPANFTMLGFRRDMQWALWSQINSYKNQEYKTKIHSVFRESRKRANKQRDLDWSENQVKQSLSKVGGGGVSKQYSSSFKIKKISSCCLQ